MFGLGLGKLGAVGGQNIESAIRALFADGTPGAWYDPSDTTTLFQDSAGTTPVTAVEQPVGLMLDKSRGLVLGSELVSNGDFSAGSTGWSVNGGWSVSGGSATHAVGTTDTLSQAISLTAGKFYQVTFTVSNASGSLSVQPRFTGGTIVAGTGRSTNGTYTEYMAAVSGNTALAFVANAAFGCTIDSISVRELPGNHAFHTPGDTTTRPVYSKRINLLTKTEQFDDATASVGWTITTGGTGAVPVVTANAGADPLGGNTADRLQTSRSSATSSDRSVRSSAVANISFEYGVAYTASFWAKAYTGSSQPIHLMLNANNAVPQSYTATDVWQRFTYTFTSGATITNSSGPFRLGLWGTASADLASDVLIWGASLVPADLAALPYQRVNTSTDYDASSVFPAYLRCDGVNDSLQTAAINFSATDKMFVSAGVRKLSDASLVILAELSTIANSNDGSFAIAAPGWSPQTKRYGSLIRGTVGYQFANTPDSFAAPISNVFSESIDLSVAQRENQLKIRVDGASQTLAFDTGATTPGAFGNHKLYLFARGGSSLPFNGLFFGSVICGKLLTASQISTVERYMAGKTKTVTLA